MPINLNYTGPRTVAYATQQNRMKNWNAPYAGCQVLDTTDGKNDGIVSGYNYAVMCNLDTPEKDTFELSSDSAAACRGQGRACYEYLAAAERAYFDD